MGNERPDAGGSQYSGRIAAQSRGKARLSDLVGAAGYSGLPCKGETIRLTHVNASSTCLEW